MSPAPTPAERVEELARHPKADAVAALVCRLAWRACEERRADLGRGLEAELEAASLTPEDGASAHGNVLEALGSGAPGLADRALVAAWIARGVGDELGREGKDGAATPDELAARLCWLGAAARIDALGVLDAALGSRAGAVWTAVAGLVRAVDAGERAELAPALVGLAALGASLCDGASRALASLVPSLVEPALLALARPPVAPAAGGAEAHVAGEVGSAPLGSGALVLATVTGWLLLRYAFRGLGLLLRVRRPAELRVQATGIAVSTRWEVLGRVVRARDIHIPTANLARAAREVRYPRFAMYAGLLALTVGSYFGLTLVTDGLRASSPSLLGIGAAILGGGVLLDFAAAVLWPGRRGKYWLLLVPRRGRRIALRTRDVVAADAALQALGRNARAAG
ncbi:MAG: hypothetical protein IT373_04020 [Polyangiaceae bacterium]|nr:hypothetical protein [Polyangiaceae bacterium]